MKHKTEIENACTKLQNSKEVFDKYSKLEKKTDILSLSKEELSNEVSKLKQPNFRANQIWQWVYHYGVKDFSKMTNISKDLRNEFSENFEILRPEVTSEQISTDGTRKWLLKMQDGQEVETVYIPEENRGTLCISSQVGCALTCKFCHTGTQNLVRNLTVSEVIAQILVAKDYLNDWPQINKNDNGRKITNVVMMGMGEPLLNYNNVAKATKIMMDSSGISLSKRKITLSTSGIVPKIYECGEELDIELAISLHATNDQLRDQIMPINKKHPIKELLEACEKYPAAKNSRRITFEYVMLKDINDSNAEARELVKLLKNIPAKVNLIPFNPWPNSPYECSNSKRITSFAKIINDAGYSSPIRRARGQDILAACGQLKSESIRKSKSVLNKNNPEKTTHP